MLMLAIALGGLGLICLFIKRTFVGVLLGIHLLSLGATCAFALGGLGAGEFGRGLVFALFVAMIGIGQLIAGWALALRLFYLGGTAKIETFRNLKG